MTNLDRKNIPAQCHGTSVFFLHQIAWNNCFNVKWQGNGNVLVLIIWRVENPILYYSVHYARIIDSWISDSADKLYSTA